MWPHGVFLTALLRHNWHAISCIFKVYNSPGLVWLNGLSASLRTKGLPVQFLVRAHAWVEGQVPSRGRMRSNHTLMFPSLSPSLLSLIINKWNLKKKQNKPKKLKCIIWYVLTYKHRHSWSSSVLLRSSFVCLYGFLLCLCFVWLLHIHLCIYILSRNLLFSPRELF